jgi:hypothetical protein
MAKAIINSKEIFGNVHLGASFDKVLEAGQISTTAGDGSYLTKTFEDISSYKTVIGKVYDTVSDVEYIDYFACNPETLSSSRDYIVRLHPSGNNIKVRLTTTSVACISCDGAWTNIFVDIIATNEDIFA